MNETAGEATNQPYLVVSMADHNSGTSRERNPVRGTSGYRKRKELVGGSSGQWRFETPRGRSP